jgi:hypothetical protein
MTDMTPSPRPGAQSLADSLLAQAAAGITLAAALIYGAGALTVALRLYFTHLPWASVLGQMPHDLIITAGFGQVMLPAVIIGLLGSIMLSFLVNQEHEKEHDKQTVALFLQQKLRNYFQDPPGLAHLGWWLAASLLLGAAEAAISLPLYLYHRSGYLHPSVVIPWLGYFLIVTLVSAIAVGIALILFPAPRQLPGAAPSSARVSKLSALQWQGLSAALVALAVIPGAAAFSASTLFPNTLVCSSTFRHGQLSGNLIGTNGGWAYMVEYRQTGPNAYSGDYFSVVPLATIKLMTIGRYADCATLANTQAPAPSTGPPVSP